MLKFWNLVSAFAFFVTGTCMSSSCIRSSYADVLFHKNTIPPAFIENYSALDSTNIEKFLEAWEDWSGRVCEGLEYNDFDKIVSRGLSYYEWSKGDTKYATLPISVPVFKKHRRINEYTPRVYSDKTVLYVTPEIENLIFPYLGGVGEGESYYQKGKLVYNRGNVEYLDDYISIHYGHWGGYWHLETMPVPESVRLTHDGVNLQLMVSFNYYVTIAIPDDEGQTIEVVEEMII